MHKTLCYFRQVRLRPLLLTPLLLAGCGDSPPGGGPPAAISLATLAHTKAAAETRRLDFSSPEVRPNLVRGWALRGREQRAAAPFIWGTGPLSSLVFQLFEVRDLELSLRCRPLSVEGRKQTVSIAVNGHEVDELVLARGQRLYEVTLPAEHLRPGENHLVFSYAYNLSPAELGRSGDERPLAVAWYEIGFGREASVQAPAERPPPRRDGLFVGYGRRQEYPLRLEAGSSLVLAAPEFTPPGGRLEVEVRAPGAEEPRLERLAAGDRRLELPLTDGEPGMVRVRLEAVPAAAPESGGPSAPAGVLLGQATVSAPAGSPSPPTTAGPGAAASDVARPIVLVYLIDTLRADRLGVFGHDRPVSPHIDAFAAEAALAERAVSQAPWTRPSVASLFTGRWPQSHGVNSWRAVMEESLAVLPELFQAAGYYTVAFVSNPQIGHEFGFARGFDEYHQLHEEDGDFLRDSARKLNDRLAAWLPWRPRDQPLLIYVHTIDPHSPYTPGEPFRQRFAAGVEEAEMTAEAWQAVAAVTERMGDKAYFRDGDLGLGSMPWMAALEEGKIEATSEQVADLLDLYDAEIAANDHEFGRFVELLREAGLWEESLVVLTSDHGEEFGEHGHWEHAWTLYGQAVEVPLIVKLPAAAGEAAPNGGVPRLIDVLPTLLAGAGLPVPPEVEGRALLAAAPAADALPADPLAFSYVQMTGVKGASVIEYPWKLIRQLDADSSLELYNLERDPEERVDLADRHPVLVSHLLELLWQREGLLHAAAEIEIDDETRRRLQALGYF